MGRPSLAEQRKTEILAAFGRCVARFGLEGSTLEKIAEEAGMRRSILRHYVGNRDELVEALADKVIADYRTETQALFEQLGERISAVRLVDFLLPNQPVGTTEQLLVIEGLIGAAHEYPKVHKLVFEYIDNYVQQVASQLKLISPASTPKNRWNVAWGLVCISFNQESLLPLNLPARYLKGARSAARTLISTLV
ncbi:MAG: TetR/AcrR family transcriptional regulator [Pirellulaceae bacterium]